ncbi:hypothetical protein BDQ12DRAFT_715879 [Crucibulum laeve]|uniref:Uncharacterized protein n=1 Tax=Crucibulum laeve TaxID=68775 RepID=A0A5C3LKL5_9AGAR|nr:hypothetical protein BDQ12DRAFT_715879 [Crucibulum laeve]
MSAITARVTFGDTLGAIFLGGIAASILYGVNCIQTFIVLKGNQADRTYLKIIIICLWIIDSIQHILVIHALYYYMVTNYANPPALQIFTWSFLAQAIAGAFTSTLVRSDSTKAIHYDNWNSVPLLLWSSVDLAGNPSFQEVKKLSKRTGFRNISIFVAVTIFHSHLNYDLTSIDLIYIWIYILSNKVYISSLLANLNAREYVRGNNHIVTDSGVATPDNEGSMDLSALSSSNKLSSPQTLKPCGIPQAHLTSLTIHSNNAIPTKVDVKVDKEISIV